MRGAGWRARAPCPALAQFCGCHRRGRPGTSVRRNASPESPVSCPDASRRSWRPDPAATHLSAFSSDGVRSTLLWILRSHAARPLRPFREARRREPAVVCQQPPVVGSTVRWSPTVTTNAVDATIATVAKEKPCSEGHRRAGAAERAVCRWAGALAAVRRFGSELADRLRLPGPLGSAKARARNRGKQVPGPIAHDAMVAGHAASRASGEQQVSADLGRETSRRTKAGPWIHRAARGCSYTPTNESGCFGPTVTTTGESTTPPVSQLATRRSSGARFGGSCFHLSEGTAHHVLVCGGRVITCDAQSLSGRGGRRSVRDRQLAEDPRYVHARGLVADE